MGEQEFPDKAWRWRFETYEERTTRRFWDTIRADLRWRLWAQWIRSVPRRVPWMLYVSAIGMIEVCEFLFVNLGSERAPKYMVMIAAVQFVFGMVLFAITETWSGYLAMFVVIVLFIATKAALIVNEIRERERVRALRDREQAHWRQIEENLIVVAHDSIRQSDGSDLCSVCLGEFDEHQMVLATPCGHHFHRHCIVRWIRQKATCPNCRQSLEIATNLNAVAHHHDD